MLYSFTGGMSPAKKESAYLHLPTYTAGMLFHVGLFTALLNLLLVVVGISPAEPFNTIIIVIMATGTVCGLFILIKRMFNQVLKSISNPDDYISNIVVTIFQALSVLAIYNPQFVNPLVLYASIMIIYIPAGKLRHSFYFFSSRIALGIFYGSRGVWGAKNRFR